MTFEQLENEIQKRELAKNSFLKNIIVISATLLAILASLYSKHIPCYSKDIFFLLAILLPLCILSGTIALYESLYVHKRMCQKIWERIQSYSREEETVKGNLSLISPKIFYICELSSYLFFVLSIITLSIYAISLLQSGCICYFSPESLSSNFPIFS